MARPRRPAQASRATRAAMACARRCARKRKTRRSVKPAPRKRNSVASKRNSAPSLMKRLFAVASLLCAACAVAAEASRKVVSLEGVTEYQLANGLRLLTLPDPGIDTATVHIPYLVRTRHEPYGEKRVAHLLDHLLFKGSVRHPIVNEE